MKASVVSMIRKGPRNLITDVAGLRVGHAEDSGARTGVTVLLADEPVKAAADVRGGAPGTRDVLGLDSASLVDTVDAITLSGGSAFGLDAPSGVQAWLRAQGRGFEIAPGAPRVPIVSGAILFDLSNGGNKEWGEYPPYRALGKLAAEKAAEDFALGNAGAGLGAIAGRYKGGIGSASSVRDDGVTVGALVAVNSVGSPIIPGTQSVLGFSFRTRGRVRRPRSERTSAIHRSRSSPRHERRGAPRRQHNHRDRRDGRGSDKCRTQAGRDHGDGRLCPRPKARPHAIRRRSGVCRRDGAARKFPARAR